MIKTSVSTIVLKRRLKNPTCDELNKRAKVIRRSETLSVSHAIHGGSSKNMDPTAYGLIDTLSTK